MDVIRDLCRCASVYRLLGRRRSGPPTSWTVWLGGPDDMARRAEAATRRGFRRLKLKLGGRDGLDIERNGHGGTHMIRQKDGPGEINGE